MFSICMNSGRYSGSVFLILLFVTSLMHMSHSVKCHVSHLTRGLGQAVKHCARQEGGQELPADARCLGEALGGAQGDGARPLLRPGAVGALGQGSCVSAVEKCNSELQR